MRDRAGSPRGRGPCPYRAASLGQTRSAATGSEAGKPYVEALLTEVLVVLDAARFYVENAYRFLRQERVPQGNLAMKTKAGGIAVEPYGVIGIILLWNYPFSIPATEGLAALVTGNAVLVKPSEFTSLCAEARFPGYRRRWRNGRTDQC
jgi:acyl-CoA reductase-like NAD-dependent aldehyde dehydrogenase